MTAAVATPPKRNALPVLGTTIGKKLIVAVTGLGWIGFVVGHMVGNLKIFLGPKHLDEYGDFLRTVGEPIFPRSVVLWIFRIGLIAMFVAHVGLTFKLSLQNRASRKDRYATTKTIQASWASKSMRWGGITLFAFIFAHLAHFTWGIFGSWAFGGNASFTRGDPYGNVTNAFYHQPVFAILYIIPMVFLGLHMYHGVWSTMQTLGINRKRFDKGIRAVATGIAVITAGGNIVIVLGATFINHVGT